jgi:hypothetical protein
MDQLFATVRVVHIVFGLLGLGVFWAPLVLKKGGVWHRRVGWVFVVCMFVASLTAAALAGLRLYLSTKGGLPLTIDAVAGPLFLVNVAALTFVSVYHGVQVLRQKKRTAALSLSVANAAPLLLPAFLLALSIATVVVGVIVRSPVLFTLPIVGLGVSSQQLYCLLRPPKTRMFWWFQHMAGMFGGCIAALTATLITNARHIRPLVPAPEWLFWIAPAAVGIPVLFWWQRRYRKQFKLKG